MPLYNYKCSSCGHKENDFFLIAAKADWTVTCPLCGVLAFEMQLSAPAIEDWGQGRHFEMLSPKGETFYDRKSYRDYLKSKGLREWEPKIGTPGCEI